MSRTQIGFLFCLSFVTLEAFQAVYLGAAFQDIDSFLVGMWVFGLAVVGCTLGTAVVRPAELVASLLAWKVVASLNVFAAFAWSAYFIAVQLIEPAVVFTVFSGTIPLAAVAANWIGVPEAQVPRSTLVSVGNLLILVAISVLAATTVAGYSGFARGGWFTALGGVGLSALSGACTAFVILYSVRLNRRGVGPLAQFGLRFVLYTLLALAAWVAGIDDKGSPPPTSELARVVLISLAVIAFPLYLMQKAVPLLHPSVIAAMTALGPAMVFLMQLFDGRVAYSSTTLCGLAVYISGALIAVFGATRPTRRRWTT